MDHCVKSNVELIAERTLEGHRLSPAQYTEIRASIVKTLTVLAEETRRELVRCQADPLQAALSDESVETYVRSLPWTSHATEDEKALVAGNISTFARALREAAAKAVA